MNGYIIALASIVASAVGVYIAASFALAQKQLLAATRLQAYLLHYARLIADWDTFKITHIGLEWVLCSLVVSHHDMLGKEIAGLCEAHFDSSYILSRGKWRQIRTPVRHCGWRAESTCRRH